MVFEWQKLMISIHIKPQICDITKKKAIDVQICGFFV